MTFAIYTKLSETVGQHWHTAKDFAHQKIASWTNSAESFRQSVQETATTTTDNTIDAVTQTINQSWQTAEQLQNMTSQAIQTTLFNPTAGINSAVNDWLIQHPTLWRLVQILDWSANHPIISLVVLLFALTLIWSIIKAIMRLIEQASWSILQVPLKLMQAALKFSFFSLVKFLSVVLKNSKNQEMLTDNLVVLEENHQNIYLEKQQRLAEISMRLEAIQKEQKELLQEASTLIAQDSMGMKIPEVIRNS